VNARRRAAWSAALGVVTTVAVAWGIAAWSVYQSGYVREIAFRVRAAGEGDGEMRMSVFRFHGSRLVESVARDLMHTDTPPPPTPEAIVPPWARAAALPWGRGTPWPAPGSQDRRVARGTGWPMIALWHEYEWHPGPPGSGTGDYQTPGGIRLETTNGHPGAWPVNYPRALPLRPVWLGLLADAAAWGGVWFVVLSPFGYVRRRRLKRGQCVRCGYPLAGLPPRTPCPECGTIPA
jgi:hypothetical protein